MKKRLCTWYCVLFTVMAISGFASDGGKPPTETAGAVTGEDFASPETDSLVAGEKEKEKIGGNWGYLAPTAEEAAPVVEYVRIEEDYVDDIDDEEIVEEIIEEETVSFDAIIAEETAVPSEENSDVVALVSREGDRLVLYPASSDGELPADTEYGDSLELSTGEKITIKGEVLSVRPRTIVGYRGRKFDADASKAKGIIAYVKAGYQWNFLRKMGFSNGDYSMRRNLALSGGTASVGLGYKFGPEIPLNLEIEVGVGPDLDFKNRRQFGSTFIESHQQLSIYTLDASIDYDIKTNTRWTPFIGITTGFALISDRGNMVKSPGGSGVGAPDAVGHYKRKHRVNLMGGARLGAKLQVHDKVTISGVAAYNYLGDIPAQRFTLSDRTQASTNRIKAHDFSLKVGLQIHF